VLDILRRDARPDHQLLMRRYYVEQRLSGRNDGARPRNAYRHYGAVDRRAHGLALDTVL
jgi:hypothetical protein